jgi:hypothetical protein
MNSQLATLNPQPAVRLHIERLVVDQSLVSSGRGDQLQAAIETELTQLMYERGLTALASSALYSLPTRNMHLAKQSRPAQLGRQIARTVYAALGSENSSPVAPDRKGSLD